MISLGNKAAEQRGASVPLALRSAGLAHAAEHTGLPLAGGCLRTVGRPVGDPADMVADPWLLDSPGTGVPEGLTVSDSVLTGLCARPLGTACAQYFLHGDSCLAGLGGGVRCPLPSHADVFLRLSF